MKSRRHGRRTGFTLLEVLVGLAIIALAATVALQSSSLAIGVTGKSADAARAALHARALLAELGISRPLTAGTFSGVGDGETQWTLTVTNTPSPTPLLRAHDIVLAVKTGGARVVLETRRITPAADTP